MSKEYSLVETEFPTPLETHPKEHKTLRFGTLDDVDDILRMARKLTKDSPIEMIGHSDKKTRESVEAALISDQSEWLCLISHDNGNPVGVLIAYNIQPLFSDNKIAMEVLMYLEPEYRKGRRGLDMMNAFEYWARLTGCKVVQYGWLANSPKEMQTLYTRLGCVKSEEVYYKCL